MKKFLSLFFVSVLIFSLCSCNSILEEDAAAPLIQNTVTETEDTENISEETKPQIIYPEVSEPEKDEPVNIAIDEPFTEDEIIVTIIKEYSRIRESFTADDFPGIEVEEARIIFTYSEDKDNRVMVRITIKDGTKQKVLDSIKILEQNPIVYRAAPNYIFEVFTPSYEDGVVEYEGIREDVFFAAVLKENSETPVFSVEDFPEVEAEKIEIVIENMGETGKEMSIIRIYIKDGTEQKILDSIEKIKQNPLVVNAEIDRKEKTKR